MKRMKDLKPGDRLVHNNNPLLVTTESTSFQIDPEARYTHRKCVHIYSGVVYCIPLEEIVEV